MSTKKTILFTTNDVNAEKDVPDRKRQRVEEKPENSDESESHDEEDPFLRSEAEEDVEEEVSRKIKSTW